MKSGTKRESARDLVYRIVRRIPRGRVMTYGQISESIERRLSALAVGWAMADAPDGLPWQRVVNARGACSTDGRPDLPPGLQRALLEREGIEFDAATGTLDLERYRWSPRREKSLGKRIASPRVSR